MEKARQLDFLKRAQLHFHLAQWVPFGLYYLGLHSETHGATFPATISFTIRKGIPKYVHHALWTLGWWNVGKFLHERQASVDVKARAFLTYIHGFLATVVFALNQDRFNNHVHGITAAAYMFEHLFLMRLFKHKQRFQLWFKYSFGAFCASLMALKALEKKFQLPPEAHAKDRREKVQTLHWLSRVILHSMSLAVMVFENGLFVAFTTGIVHDPMQ